jgi:hypothetical protein
MPGILRREAGDMDVDRQFLLAWANPTAVPDRRNETPLGKQLKRAGHDAGVGGSRYRETVDGTLNFPLGREGFGGKGQ